MVRAHKTAGRKMMHHEGAPRPMALNHTFERLQLQIDLQHPRLPATYNIWAWTMVYPCKISKFQNKPRRIFTEVIWEPSDTRVWGPRNHLFMTGRLKADRATAKFCEISHDVQPSNASLAKFNGLPRRHLPMVPN